MAAHTGSSRKRCATKRGPPWRAGDEAESEHAVARRREVERSTLNVRSVRPHATHTSTEVRPVDRARQDTRCLLHVSDVRETAMTRAQVVKALRHVRYKPGWKFR